MPDRQLTLVTNDIAHLVNSAYGKLRIGAFGDAAKVLERALELDVEYEGITATLKSVRFWGERRRRLRYAVGASNVTRIENMRSNEE